MVSTQIITELQDGVLSLGLNRPERRNALTPELYVAWADALFDAAGNSEVRAVVLHGNEDVFCAGNDIDNFAANLSGDAERPSRYFMRALSSLMKPVVAAVNGPAVGIGATLLLHCDFVYMGQGAQLIFPFVKLGLCPEFGSTLLLVSRLGYQRAADLLLLGEVCDAQRALQLGLANQVLQADAVLPHARQVAARLASQPVLAVQVSKTLMREGLAQACEQQIEKETIAFSRLLESPDAKAAFDAFIKRRKQA